VTATLLLGASGQLGSAFGRKVEGVVSPGRGDLDLAHITPESVLEVMDSVEPDVIINCAAWTAVDAAEMAEEEANLVNGAAVGVLAAAADQRSIPFVTFSTDYVFDGSSGRAYREEDPPNPINAYGRSKLLGEELALRHPLSLVIRTSWVQSGTHSCFIRKMIELAGERDALRVVDDQIGRPTFADDLADATITALDLDVRGLVHMANSGEASWYELAKETLELAGMATHVEPIPSSEFEIPAPRPHNSVLDLKRMSDLGIPELPSWQATLADTIPTIMKMYQ